MDRKVFSSDEIVKKRNYADLAEYGDFVARYIIVDPENPVFIKAVGSLYTQPNHLPEAIEIENAELEIELSPFWAPDDETDLDWPPPDVVRKMSASELFQAPWFAWQSEQIPEHWEY